MRTIHKTLGIAAGLSALAVAGCATAPYPQGMTFFVTSVGMGKGADLGGIEGADRHCEALAAKEAVFGCDNADVALTASNLAALLAEVGGPQEALALARRALTALEAELAPHHPHVVLCRESVVALEREAV